MMQALLMIAAGICLLGGAAFALVGALGILRFPDVYTRTHAASKAGTLGSGLCLVAVALAADTGGAATRAIVAVVFFMLTAPVAAHLLARAAFRAGYPAVADRNAYLGEVHRASAAEKPPEGEDIGRN
jgi:multicomponent Na+:H+ antiporter subunit G